ncbi:MAG: MOSC domain-containing protein [Campylobacterales bacterium]|nr:MOSC domain-containing protein [Campylobacterales bacterium]
MEDKVLNLFLAKEKNSERENQEVLNLDELGVIGDRFYGKKPKRSVLITSISSYQLMKENNIEAQYGQLGENILVDCDIYDLEVGSKLEIGQVELEISQPGTLCQGLAKVDDSLPNLLQGNRGIFAQVKKSGKIYCGDNVKVTN